MTTKTIGSRGRAGQWGNSVGVRLSDALATAAGIRAGTPIRVRRVPGGILIERLTHELSLKELVARVTPESRHELVWDDIIPVGREVW